MYSLLTRLPKCYRPHSERCGQAFLGERHWTGQSRPAYSRKLDEQIPCTKSHKGNSRACRPWLELGAWFPRAAVRRCEQCSAWWPWTRTREGHRPPNTGRWGKGDLVGRWPLSLPSRPPPTSPSSHPPREESSSSPCRALPNIEERNVEGAPTREVTLGLIAQYWYMYIIFLVRTPLYLQYPNSIVLLIVAYNLIRQSWGGHSRWRKWQLMTASKCDTNITWMHLVVAIRAACWSHHHQVSRTFFLSNRDMTPLLWSYNNHKNKCIQRHLSSSYESDSGASWHFTQIHTCPLFWLIRGKVHVWLVDYVTSLGPLIVGCIFKVLIVWRSKSDVTSSNLMFYIWFQVSS